MKRHRGRRRSKKEQEQGSGEEKRQTRANKKDNLNQVNELPFDIQWFYTLSSPPPTLPLPFEAEAQVVGERCL